MTHGRRSGLLGGASEPNVSFWSPLGLSPRRVGVCSTARDRRPCPRPALDCGSAAAAGQQVIEVREFNGRDRVLMQQIARQAWPATTRHPGGLGWSLATLQLAEKIVIIERDGLEVAWAGISQPGDLRAQSVTDDADVSEAIATWALSELQGEVVQVPLTVDDQLLSGFLLAGFRVDEDADPVFGMYHDAADVAHAETPYVVQSAGSCDPEARVDVHRRAWRPADLPWHPDHRPPTSPDAESGYDRSKHERVRRTWLYDEALDLVAFAPDGSLAGCCIAWFDPEIGVAEIEPLGVVPAHRRQGVAGLLCQEVVRRVAACGGREVLISAGPRESYPANAAAYAKAGFALRQRGTVYSSTR